MFMHNTTGYMVGKDYEQGGIIKHGAQMINAVSNSKVPHLGVIMAASYGAGNYGMSGRAYDPRFLFSWPSAQSAVMGPQQLAGVLSIVARASAEGKGVDYDEDADKAMREMVEAQIESEQTALANSSRGLRRRHHRPARHPHGPGHGAERGAQRRGQGRRGLRRLPDVAVKRVSGRQPGRDRPSHHPHLPPPGHRHGGGVLRGRRRGAVRARGRPRRGHRRPRPGRLLPARRRGGAGRAGRRRRRRPPRLRLPGRERRVRPLGVRRRA